MDILEFYNDIPPTDMELLTAYLKGKKEVNKSNKFKVVMDLLHECNLNCLGCGTNANCIENKNGAKIPYADLKSIERACERIKEYTDLTQQEVFINLGGGEPFLRKDILDVIHIINSFFGSKSVGIDTNAALSNSLELIEKALTELAYVGISVNGLCDYHNWYSGRPIYNAYEKTTSTLKELCKNEKFRAIGEVTSVATKKNIDDLPVLFEILVGMGVKNYSVHRAIPVGRMGENIDSIPRAKDYLHLLIELLKVSQRLDVPCHIHHSIENIHRSILLGEQTYCESKVGDRNQASSIGITPEGNVVFDAWSMSGIWKTITCGNIFESEVPLQKILEQDSSVFNDVSRLSDSHHRCKGCQYPCAGGNRIVAAATEMTKMQTDEIDFEQMKKMFEAIDPACPMYDRK